MTYQLNHCDLPVQKAGQAVGAALLQPPLPSNIAPTLQGGTASAVPVRLLQIWTLVRASGGAARVAGGGAGSMRTGTAAPTSRLPGVLPNQRRVLRRPLVARNALRKRSMQRNAASPHYLFRRRAASVVPCERMRI
jgi:hypothetical protein